MAQHGDKLEALRVRIDVLNEQLLQLLCERARITGLIQELKTSGGLPLHDPEREQAMLSRLLRANPGPLPEAAVVHLFGEIFKTTKSMMEHEQGGRLSVARKPGTPDVVLRIAGHTVGQAPVLIAGPCSVESAEQIDQTAAFLASRGVRFLRGGAYKPRTSPHDFQGLGEPGLQLLSAAARRQGMASVTEVVDTRHVEQICRSADVLQVGARNMQNFELLKEVGRCGHPVLLKRGLAATLKELLHAAEYVYAQGNRALMLCERGIRSFETETRNTLDISAVPLLRQATALPVFVDVSHAAGRRDILAPLARAALAAGAQGIMLEVHPCPAVARSDSQQQLDFAAFDAFFVQTFAVPTGRLP